MSTTLQGYLQTILINARQYGRKGELYVSEILEEEAFRVSRAMGHNGWCYPLNA
jgi:hypothetical protein